MLSKWSFDGLGCLATPLMKSQKRCLIYNFNFYDFGKYSAQGRHVIEIFSLGGDLLRKQSITLSFTYKAFLETTISMYAYHKHFMLMETTFIQHHLYLSLLCC